MQAIVTVPTEGRDREFVLSLSRADYLVTDGAAVSVTVTRPNIRREISGQLAGPNTLPGECQNLRECHTNLPWRLRSHPYAGGGLRVWQLRRHHPVPV